MRKTPAALLALSLSLCATALALAASKAPDVIQLSSPAFNPHRAGPVAFQHGKHEGALGIACAECHHVYEGGKNVWKEGDPVGKCQACHTDATNENEGALPPDLQAKNLKLAFHTNCIQCHRKARQENPRSPAPTVCARCHARR